MNFGSALNLSLSIVVSVIYRIIKKNCSNLRQPFRKKIVQNHQFPVRYIIVYKETSFVVKMYKYQGTKKLMIMDRKTIYVLCFMFLFSTFFISAMYSQVSSPLVVDNAIKVNLRQPTHISDRYLENNKRKNKKFKTKVKLSNGWGASTYLHYSSKPMEKRKRVLAHHHRKKH